MRGALLRHLGLILGLCLALLGGAAAGATTGPLDLSPAQAQWAAAHPSVEVLLVDGSVPYLERQPDGTPRGFAIDMMALLAERSGLRWQYRWLPSDAALAERLAQGGPFVTPMSAPPPLGESRLVHPGGWLAAEIAVVTRTDLPDASLAQDFVGRRIAAVVDHPASRLLRSEYPRAQVTTVRNVPEALKAVSTGQADATVLWLHEALYHIEANLLANLRVRRESHLGRGALGPAVPAGQPELAAIIGQALERISLTERETVSRRWLPRGSTVIWRSGNVQLSPAEQAWVAAKGRVRVAFDREFAPFSVGSSLGGFEGLGADMFRLAASKVGLEVAAQRGGSFADALQAARTGDVDVVVGMARTESRRGAFNFIGPFSSTPTVLVVRSADGPNWQTLDDIGAAGLGLLKDHFLIPQLRSRRPGLPLVVFDTQKEALQALSEGRVAAALGNAAVVTRLIDHHFAGHLQVAGIVPESDSDLYFGVPNDKPELTRLLAKGFAAITPAEADAISRRWLLVTVQPGLRWEVVLRWALPIGLATLLVLTVLWRSRRHHQRAHHAVAQAWADAEQARSAEAHARAVLTDLTAQVPGVVFRYEVDAQAQLIDRYVSPGYADLTGLPSPADGMTLLQGVLQHVREDQRDAARAAERHSARTGAPFKLTVPFLHPQRGEVWLHCEARYRDEGAGRGVWTGYVVDVTPERELQARLASEAEARNLQLASASHELRAPTHALSLALASVQGERLSGADAQALALAQQSAGTLAQLLDDVLQAARFSGGAVRLRPRRVALRAWLDEVAGAWRAAAGTKGLAFDDQRAADLPEWVWLDPLRLRQVLTNLLSNACKYTDAGQVSLHARVVDGQLQLAVTDTGRGIAPQAQARLFQPFTTAHGDHTPREGSFGLGLAICRQLVTLMGGTLALASEPGRGTTVTVTLPLPDLRSSAPPRREGRVLVCDDDPVSRLMTAEMLGRAGLDVTAVADAAEALAQWRAGGVAVIVTDLDMPGLGGRGLIREVRAAQAGLDEARRTPIIVCSGVEPSDLRSGHPDDLPADAHLIKPVAWRTLLQALAGVGLSPR